MTGLVYLVSGLLYHSSLSVSCDVISSPRVILPLLLILARRSLQPVLLSTFTYIGCFFVDLRRFVDSISLFLFL